MAADTCFITHVASAFKGFARKHPTQHTEAEWKTAKTWKIVSHTPCKAISD